MVMGKGELRPTMDKSTRLVVYITQVFSFLVIRRPSNIIQVQLLIGFQRWQRTKVNWRATGCNLESMGFRVCSSDDM